MSKTVIAPLAQLRFSPNCVICLSPASKTYPIQQVFTFGRRAHTITVDVPMCNVHHEKASYKSPVERAFGCLGIVGGILAGILMVILLFMRWVGDNSLGTKIFVAAIVGFGIFVLVWWIIAVQIAPLFAVPESKEVRKAVRITRFLPNEHMVQLEFKNEQAADLIQNANV